MFTSLLILVSLIAIHYYLNKNTILVKFYFFTLGFKFFCGFLLYELHLRFGVLPDIVLYERDVERLSNFFWTDTGNYFWFLLSGKTATSWHYTFATEGERAFFFARYLSLIGVLGAKNMYLVSLYSSFMTFLGLWACANRLGKWFLEAFGETQIKKLKVALLVGFFFLPSVAFWSSSLMKESFLWFLMGFSIAFFIDIFRFDFRKENLSIQNKEFIGIVIKIILLFPLLLSLFLLKYYYFALLVPLLVAFWITFGISNFLKKRVEFSFAIQLLSFVVSFSVVVSLASTLHPNLWLSRLSEAIFINQQKILDSSEPKNQITFTYNYDLEINYNDSTFSFDTYPTLWQLSEQSPKALLAGLFSPLSMNFSGFGEKTFNYFKLASVLENWLILFLFIHTISIKKLLSKLRYYFSSENWINLRKEKQSLILFWIAGVLFCLGMATLLALSAPNVGALVRYRVGFLPFFVFGIIMRLD